MVSSLLFGALHTRWLAGTVAGMCDAWARSRRGRVDDAVLAHAITNALIAADVLILVRRDPAVSWLSRRIPPFNVATTLRQCPS